MNRPAVIALAIVFACAVGVGGVLYAFGTPDAQAAVAPAAATSQPIAAPSSSAVPQPDAEAAAVPDTPGQVPQPDPNMPLAIEIPGCVCHSDDPKIVGEHAQYRMNQCAGCHRGEVPTGQ